MDAGPATPDSLRSIEFFTRASFGQNTDVHSPFMSVPPVNETHPADVFNANFQSPTQYRFRRRNTHTSFFDPVVALVPILDKYEQLAEKNGVPFQVCLHSAPQSIVGDKAHFLILASRLLANAQASNQNAGIRVRLTQGWGPCAPAACWSVYELESLNMSAQDTLDPTNQGLMLESPRVARSLLFEVADNGCGCGGEAGPAGALNSDSDIAPKRGRSSAASPGLDLDQAKQLAHALGGEITLSKTPVYSRCFRFWMPLVPIPS